MANRMNSISIWTFVGRFRWNLLNKYCTLLELEFDIRETFISLEKGLYIMERATYTIYSCC